MFMDATRLTHLQVKLTISFYSELSQQLSLMYSVMVCHKVCPTSFVQKYVLTTEGSPLVLFLTSYMLWFMSYEHVTIRRQNRGSWPFHCFLCGRLQQKMEIYTGLPEPLEAACFKVNLRLHQVLSMAMTSQSTGSHVFVLCPYIQQHLYWCY